MATSQGFERRLEGKVAIVTGAASGFGLAITQLFASHGCRVVATDLHEAQLHQQFSTAQHVTAITADVTNTEDWARVAALTIREYGRIDILVNNAGTSYRNKPTLNVTEDEFDLVMNVNVKSVFLSIGAVVPRMIEGRGGSIINVASVGAIRPRGGLVWYSASKGAALTASKALASEYGPDQIRVNAICPLLSGTGLFEAFVGVPDTLENRNSFTKNIPLGRLTDPQDVANAALYLASDDSKFVTGIALEVDGGRAI